eukprot:7950951-Prorocentrum_lima.AAC.1
MLLENGTGGWQQGDCGMGVGDVQSGKEGGGGARRVVHGATSRTKAGNVKDSHWSRASITGNT